MTYNILANCYSDSALAKEELYTYCPSEFLEFRYRRILLVHEIKRILFEYLVIYLFLFLVEYVNLLSFV